MKTKLHLKIISIIIAFSLLFLALHNQQPILAETIKTFTYLLIVIYFITIWMQAKKVVHFISSILLPCWLLVLYNSGSITDYLFLQKTETKLQEIAILLKVNSKYEKLTDYSIFDFNNNVDQAHTENLSYTNFSNLKRSKKISSPILIQLLKENHLIGFKICHNSILFRIKNHRQLRYYFKESDFFYSEDKEIKPQWYQVN
jgi:hypothetical protein